MLPHVARKGELAGDPTPPVPASGPNELNVALYPYVPSPQAFVAQTQLVWSQVQPSVTLNFVEYKPYEWPPDPNLDVFAFDCIFADDLVKCGFVDRIGWSEIADPSDLLPFASQCAGIDSSSAAGIPYLGCTNVLYYRAGDRALDKGRPLGVGDLARILGPATSPGPAPRDDTGLIMDLGGKTTNACVYAGIWRQESQKWWPHPVPMQDLPSLDARAMRLLAAYARIVGRDGGQYEDSGHDRTGWFQDGRGRALVGLTETMSGWPAAFRETIGFRPLPIAATGNAARIPCYADAVGIRPGLGHKRAWAVQLANVVASAPVSLGALYPSGSAQYLMPARKSVLTRLGRMLPEYAAIEAMLAALPPTPVRLGLGAQAWARPAGAEIIKRLFTGRAEELAAPPRRRHPAYNTTPAGMWRRGE
jgi:thiamine pyridinylase